MSSRAQRLSLPKTLRLQNERGTFGYGVEPLDAAPQRAPPRQPIARAVEVPPEPAEREGDVAGGGEWTFGVQDQEAQLQGR